MLAEGMLRMRPGRRRMLVEKAERWGTMKGEATHTEAVVGGDQHSEGDLLALLGRDCLPDLDVLESHRRLLHLSRLHVAQRLPRSYHVGRGGHQDAPVDHMVAQELVVSPCTRTRPGSANHKCGSQSSQT